MMETFYEELLPVLAEFTPGIGDLIGAYNDFQNGDYFWGIFGIISTLIPGDEMLKAWRKADNIRDGWKAVKAVWRVWDNIMGLVGSQKVLNKLPQAWKDLPGSKLANNQKGLAWQMNQSSYHFRLMEAVPGSQNPNKQVPYARFLKSGSGTGYMTTTGDWAVPTGVANQYIHNGTTYFKTDPIFQELTHIPIDDITDDMLDDFF